MMGYKQGEVVLIPFPFTDLTTTKQRPALVLSSDSYNQSHPDVIAAAITSKIPGQLKADEFLISESDLNTAGLPKPSIIRLGKVVTIDQRLIRRKLGQLSPDAIRKIKEIFLNQF